MCFAPKRRALFRHLNFEKWSERGVFCTFWLLNVLRATTACTSSTSQLPKVVRTWCVLRILTCKCASRHNGVQFFISHLASWLRTRRFSEPTFRPSGAPNHWKNAVFRDFPTFSILFSHLHLLSSYSFSSTLLSSNLSLLSASSLLCFSSVHIVGSLTSKLPSTIYVCVCIVNIYINICIYIKTVSLRVLCCCRISSPFGSHHNHPRLTPPTPNPKPQIHQLTAHQPTHPRTPPDQMVWAPVGKYHMLEKHCKGLLL